MQAEMGFCTELSSIAFTEVKGGPRGYNQCTRGICYNGQIVDIDTPLGLNENAPMADNSQGLKLLRQIGLGIYLEWVAKNLDLGVPWWFSG